MEFEQFMVDLLDRARDGLEKTLEGLTVEELNKQPGPESNSIGWLAWHLTRVQDRAIANLAGNKQVYISGKWYEKFSRASDPEDTGRLHTAGDLAAFRAPESKTLMVYHLAVFEKTKEYVSGLTTRELGRKIEHPRFPTAGAWLVATVSDSLQHAGQAAYARGLLQGSGWIAP
jgi:hypothetical protein